MASLSNYQQMRRANLNENNQLLMEYGLQAPVVESKSVTLIEDTERKKRPSSTGVKKRMKKDTPISERRTSFRVRLKVQQDYFEDYESLKDSDEEDEQDLLKNLSQPNRKVVRPPRPNSYGPIQGVKVGTWWETRLDCNYDGIHRPTVAGIHQGPDGAYSVALSGGYEDDRDLGDSFTYTGEGGRDLKGTASNPKNLRTAPQSKHQTLTRGNFALSRNVETGNPVRVIRGYKLNSTYAPERGYRYDGLYNVTKCWEEMGKAGYRVYKFQFVRCNQEPAPWHEQFQNNKEFGELETTQENDLTWQRTPTKVREGDVETTNSSLSGEDDIWQGWPVAPCFPRTNRLTIVCGDEVDQLCLIGDQWSYVSDAAGEHCEPPCIPSEERPQQQCDKSSACENPEQIPKQGLKDLMSLEDAENYSGKNWCGWDIEKAMEQFYFTVQHDDCSVRVCQKGGQWLEMNSKEGHNTYGIISGVVGELSDWPECP